jgi:DNA polymerase-3 subunit chi
MTEIRFYHMERQGIEQVLPSLLMKALENGHRILVKAPDEPEAERLNEILWTFRPDIFLPHGTKKDGHSDRQPIFLTSTNDNPNNADVLILTGGTESDSIADFKLCCELLDGRDGEQIEQARARWKKYKDEGHTLTYWQQGEKSWEKKNSA